MAGIKYVGRNFFKLIQRAFIAFLLFHQPFISASDTPLPGQILPKNADDLLDWEPGIYRIEVISGGEEGNHAYGHRPRLSFRIIETIRPCRDYIGDPTQPITVDWIGNQTQFLKYAEEKRHEEWDAMRIRSPATGTKAIIMTMQGMLSQDGFWADTEENLNTARTYHASRPMTDIFAEFAFYGSLFFPWMALAFVFLLPRVSMGIVFTGWASAYIYNASVPSSSNIRVDLVLIIPCAALGFLVFILASWLILKRRKK